MIPQEDIDRIRDRLDIVDVVRSYLGAELKRAGRSYVALCPFHKERTPSFNVFPERQMFKCFGCGEYGDVFAFVMKRSGLSFGEVLKELARQAGVELRIAATSPAERAQQDAKQRLYSAMSTAAEHYHRLLRESPAAAEARRYLRERGITAATVAAYRLGYAPERGDLGRALRDFGITPEALNQVGLLRAGQQQDRWYDFFRGRLLIPIADAAGRIVSFGGRLLAGGEGPKYINTAESPIYQKSRLLFGLDRAAKAIRQDGTAVVVEGYFDVLLPAQSGLPGFVAPCGTSLTAEHAALLRRHARRVVVLMDADAAGERGAGRAAELLLRTGVQVALATLDAGADPADMIQQDRSDVLVAKIAGAMPAMSALIDMAVRRFDLRLPDQKVAALESLLPVLAVIPDEVERYHFCPIVAHRLGIPDEVVLNRLRRRRERDGAGSSGATADTAGNDQPGTAPAAERAAPAVSATERNRAGYRGGRGGWDGRRREPTPPPVFAIPFSPPALTLSPEEILEGAMVAAMARHPTLAADTLAEYPVDSFRHGGFRKAAALLAVHPVPATAGRLLSELGGAMPATDLGELAKELTRDTSVDQDNDLLRHCLVRLRQLAIRQELRMITGSIQQLESEGAREADSGERLQRLVRRKSELRQHLRNLEAAGAE
ncbi:MAG: DNA primase [Candidatus Schekmanbacteria bacterium]|nr:DNA primase [Candidatus Schekmanbacteria bacterium]